jgi:hypothetical protein
MKAAGGDRCSRRHRRWVDQAFVGTLGPRKWPRLQAHLEQCPRCRQEFDRLGYVDRALAPGSQVSAVAVDRMRAQVLAATPPPRRAWLWAGTGAAAAACAAVILLAVVPAARDSFAPRGMEQRWRGERPPGVRMFCIDPAASRVSHEARAVEHGLPASTLRCRMGDELQITYSTPNLEGLTMVVFSRDETGNLHYYAPRNGHSPALHLDPDAIDAALDWSTRLAVNHQAGSHDLEVLFFDQPVQAHEAASGQVAPLERLVADLVIEEDRP